MNTVQTLEIASSSSSHTLEIGAAIGSSLRGGECFALDSDLGGGKTTLTQGIAEGFGSSSSASSPSFTIANVYDRPADDVVIRHFDFYRLDDPGIIALELQEHLVDHKTVCIVEWGDIVSDVLPPEHIKISITPTSEQGRKITIEYSSNYEYLVEGLKS